MTRRAYFGFIVSMAIRAAKKTTVTSDILNTPLQTLVTRAMYVILLFAFLAIGYLLGSIFPLEGKSIRSIGSTTAAPAAAGDTAPAAQQPGAPDPKQVLKDLKMGHLPVEGKDNAKVTIVEFSDFECPFCGRFFQDTLAQIRKDYVDTGKVKIYYRHFPLDFHPKAKPLAIASECANDQDAFWKMHDRIFENTATISTVTDDTIKQWAGELGLNTGTFNSCFDAKEHEDIINEDQQAGAAVGVSGTPTFYINGQQLVGAQPYASFKAIIDQELAK